jgi:hypothetical protein
MYFKALLEWSLKLKVHKNVLLSNNVLIRTIGTYEKNWSLDDVSCFCLIGQLHAF